MWFIFAPCMVKGLAVDIAVVAKLRTRERCCHGHLTHGNEQPTFITPPTHFASSIWSFWQFVKNCIIVKSRRVSWPGCKNKESMRSQERSGDDW